jgi:hypothetical protein
VAAYAIYDLRAKEPVQVGEQDAALAHA